MGALDTLMGWFADVLDPMKAFRTHATNLANVHQNALQQFDGSVQKYTQDHQEPLSQNTFTGEFAQSFLDAVETYGKLEGELSAADELVGTLEEIALALEDCAMNITLAIEAGALELEGEATLLEITGAVDAAAVVEGGLNPIADVAGIILTLIEGATVLYTLERLGEEVYNDVKRLLNDLNRLSNAILPATAPEPSGNSNPPTLPNKPFSQADLQAIMNNPANSGIPQTTVEGLLKRGLSKDDINYIIGRLKATRCTIDQINTFLNGLLLAGLKPGHMEGGEFVPDRIMSYFKGRYTATLKQLVEDYSQVADLPGIQRVLGGIIAAPDDNARRGYEYELQWMKAHKDQIARVEDQENGKSAADVIIKSGVFSRGSVIDLKSYSWTKYVDGKPIPVYDDSQIQAKFNSVWKPQIDRYRRLYGPNYQIVYCFDTSTSGKLPQKVIDVLIGYGVTVTTWPGDPQVNTYYPAPTAGDPSSGGNPQISLPSGGNDPQLPGPSGGDTPQLPSPSN